MKGQLIVLDAGGCLGRKAVAAALEAGRHVAAVVADTPAADELQRWLTGSGVPIGTLVTLAASVVGDDDAAALAGRIRELERPVDGVIATIGDDIRAGRLLDQPADALRTCLDAGLLPHLHAARHLLPLLAESKRGGYVLIGGPGAEHPWAGYGQQSIAAAALRMLARVLHDEARALAVRVQLLAIDSPTRTEANARHACSGWPSVDAIARHAVAMTAGVEPPTHAVVRFAAARARPSTLWSDDIDDEDTVLSPQPAGAANAPSGSQAADGNAAQPARRSPHDVRDLLRPFSLPRNQDIPS